VKTPTLTSIFVDSSCLINQICGPGESRFRSLWDVIYGTKGTVEMVLPRRNTALPPQLAIKLSAGQIVPSFKGLDRPLPSDRTFGRQLKGTEGKAVWVAQPTDETIRSVRNRAFRVVEVALRWVLRYLTNFLTCRRGVHLRRSSPSMPRYYFGVSLGWTLVRVLCTYYLVIA